ncbi:MAG: hypothetical protein KDK33_15425, partial [Leptospiraceae bacterium]|nr:hypothetical protein [Leptospiraceae bacterium]
MSSIRDRLQRWLRLRNRAALRRTGLTLVEMALATAVTAVFTITIASVLSAAINNQALAERLTIASTL